MTKLVPISEVERMLAGIETLSDAATVRRAATAVKELARQAGLSLEEQNRAAEAKIRAEWQGGRLLKRMPRAESPVTAGVAGPGRGKKTNGSAAVGLSPYAVAIKDAGIEETEARRWQRLADFDEPRLTEIVRSCNNELTTAYVLRAWRREEKNEKPDPEADALAVRTLDELVGSGRKFSTIYADPPWLYGNQGTRGATGDHYGGMTAAEVAALPVKDIVADDAHLHLWTTNAFLFDAREVIEAWGFTYKSCFVWVKPQMGMGNYWRVSHEFCLFGVRGSASFGSRSEMSWREWRRGRHSAKPEPMYELIEKVSPSPYVELFARRRREGWSAWGNQIGTDLFFQEAV